ncbi:MAG: hypothetical protein COA63_014270 [Methylophaga sp.]|nr:hypothetical protein [Methylophaga sp.]
MPDINADKLLDKTFGQLFGMNGSTFLGRLLCTIDFKWNDQIPTACTDGSYIHWNKEWFLELTEPSRVTILAHELWHVAFMHNIRRGGRTPKRWNYAADYVINNMLKKEGYDFSDLKGALLDYKYNGMGTEEVYKLLPEEEDGDSKLPMLDVLDAPSEAVKNDIIAKVVGAQTVAKMRGKAGEIPGEISLELDKYLKPKLPWESILFNFMNELTEMEYSFRRPNRRYEDPLMRGLIGMTGLEHLIYYLDISGSISDEEINIFNNEVRYIKEELCPKKLTLVTFDTKICDEYVFEQDDDFYKIVVTGRGGTDLKEVFEHANANNPSAIIIFSDMWVGIPKKPPAAPLIWVCINNKGVKVPYGKLIHLEVKN